MELEKVVAIVTGAGNGLGAAITKKMLDDGASIAMWDMDFESVRELAAELDPTGARAFPVKVDVTSEAETTEAVRETVKKFGRIDALVNNAGVSRHKPLDEMSMELWDFVIKVNLTGPFLCCKAVAPVMRKQGSGKIVNIASLGGRTGRAVGVNYAASKAGLIGVTKCLAKELGADNIYVNAVCPGPILTEQTKQYSKEVFDGWNAGRVISKDGFPEDIGDAVVFLASRRSDWVTGVTLDVNGGIFIG